MADERSTASEGNVGRELLAEGRLADARFADDHDEAALTGERRIEGLLELPHLVLAPDEGAAVERVVGGRRRRVRGDRGVAGTREGSPYGYRFECLTYFGSRRGTLVRVFLEQAQDQG